MTYKGYTVQLAGLVEVEESDDLGKKHFLEKIEEYLHGKDVKAIFYATRTNSDNEHPIWSALIIYNKIGTE